MHARGVHRTHGRTLARACVCSLAASGVGADYITIDIAHGHANSVHHMIDYIKAKARPRSAAPAGPAFTFARAQLPDAFVIAGNVATPEAVIDLESHGADATKVPQAALTGARAERGRAGRWASARGRCASRA